MPSHLYTCASNRIEKKVVIGLGIRITIKDEWAHNRGAGEEWQLLLTPVLLICDNADHANVIFGQLTPFCYRCSVVLGCLCAVYLLILPPLLYVFIFFGLISCRLLLFDFFIGAGLCLCVCLGVCLCIYFLLSFIFPQHIV